MIKFITAAIAATFLAVTLTLSIVTFSRTRSLEARVTALTRQVKKTSGNLEELSGEVAQKEDRKPDPDATPHWSYEGALGPDHWGESFAQCATGKEQSPIDIRGPFDKAADALKVNYHPMLLRIVNNGRTIQVNAEPGNTLVVGNTTWELVEFHFHRPSEERVAGKAYAMTVHFVHKNAEGKLAVLGVMLNEGRDSAIINTLWSNAPPQEGPEKTVPGMAINPADLIPATLDYYSYGGSLSTPPCTEGVNFYILKNPSTISAAQVEKFPFHLNARPVQPLNDRHIQAN